MTKVLGIIRKRSFLYGILFAFMLAVSLCACTGITPDKAGIQNEDGSASDTGSTVTLSENEDPALPKLSLTRTPGKAPDGADKADKEDTKTKEDAGTKEDASDPASRQEEITEDGIYHDLESVVLYYDKYKKLPSNFITKKEAKDLGWEGGELDPYRKGASIGGDHFGNFERKLPAGKGIKYIECDIDTDGGKRGAKRLIISSNGRYYYTPDHYETFEEVSIVDGRVVTD